GDLLRHREGEVLAERRVRDDVVVGDGVARVGEELRQSELEDAPRALEDSRTQLADHAGRSPRRLPGMEEVMVGPFELAVGLERRVDRFDDALRAREAPLDDS